MLLSAYNNSRTDSISRTRRQISTQLYKGTNTFVLFLVTFLVPDFDAEVQQDYLGYYHEQGLEEQRFSETHGVPVEQTHNVGSEENCTHIYGKVS